MLCEYLFSALLLVENMKDIGGLISVVKLRVNVVIWCFGFVLGEKVYKNESYELSCW